MQHKWQRLLDAVQPVLSLYDYDPAVRDISRERENELFDAWDDLTAADAQVCDAVLRSDGLRVAIQGCCNYAREMIQDVRTELDKLKESE